MQITLEELEILAAVKEYIKNQGLTFGEREPKVTLDVNGSKKDPEIVATISLNNALKIPMGPGEVELLTGKTEDNNDFTLEPEKAEEPKPKPKPLNNKKPETFKEAITEAVAEAFPDSDVEEEEKSDNVPNTSEGKVEEENPFEVDTPGTPDDSEFEEEKDDLVEDGENITADSLFA